jgi:hypothetical protein
MIDKENILRARQVNIIRYLQSKGVKLIKTDSRRYKHSEHDSLKFNDNAYYWNSQSESGNTLDYAVKYLGMTFQEAVKDLCNFSGTYIEIAEEENTSFSINDIEFTKDLRRSIAYLNKIRGIDYKFIKLLIDMKLISQTKENNNIAFLINDEHLQTVGIELNTSLSNCRFKGLSSGSKYGYGFNIRNTNTPTNIIYSESAIDLISFMQYIGFEKSLNKLNDTIFVSMAGLKENVVNCMNEIYKPRNVIFCTDNPNIDKASKSFFEMQKKRSNDIKLIYPAKCKDWNDYLRESK